MIHARKAVTVTAEDDHFRLVIDGEMIGAVPRATTCEMHRFKVHRFKAYAHQARPPRAPDTRRQETRQR